MIRYPKHKIFEIIVLLEKFILTTSLISMIYLGAIVYQFLYKNKSINMEIALFTVCVFGTLFTVAFFTSLFLWWWTLLLEKDNSPSNK